MIRTCAAAILLLVLTAHDGMASPCAPIQIFLDNWMGRDDGNYEAFALHNAIGQAFLDHGVNFYDAETATAAGSYLRFEIRVTTVSCFQPPGNVPSECDLRVSVYDWQGILFADHQPCESPRLIHSKVWHVSSPASYAAVGSYYYQNRSSYPAVFAAPATSTFSAGATMLLLALAALWGLRRRPAV